MMNSHGNLQSYISKSIALKFLIPLGLRVSLQIWLMRKHEVLQDLFATLGASVVIIGFVTGFEEFLGYSLRLGSGYLTDKI